MALSETIPPCHTLKFQEKSCCIQQSDHLPRITGLPSQVNAAIALLAYDPVPSLGAMPLSSKRLTEAELAAHFGNLTLELEEGPQQISADGSPFFCSFRGSDARWIMRYFPDPF